MSAVASPVLPTLLTSRPRVAPDGKGAQPWSKLPESYAIPVRVHNTFIDTCAELSPTLAGLCREREARTCPSASIGRLHDLFRDDDDAETQLPSESPETRSASEASPTSVAAAQPACVISLSGLLGAPVPPPPPALHSLAIYGGLGGARPAAEVQPGSSLLGGVGCAAELQWEGARCSTRVVQLQAVPPPPERPAPGSAEMPSVGSAGHAEGSCKPCAFLHTVGCANGLTCQFCHLCDAEERRRRRRAKHEARRLDRLRRAGGAAGGREEAAEASG
mmetsp:Transcript_21773/g.68468  ORF Transcript_21773/g.68468 Transcript_21773/m.68468 type:complete len:276 (+) Transcript_21773:65-892(+)